MRFFVSNAEKSLQFHGSGNVLSKNGFRYKKNTFSFYVLILVKEGTLYIAQNGIRHEIRKNQYIILNANEEQFGYRVSTGKLSYDWVYFSFTDPVIIHKNSKFIHEYIKKRTTDSNNSVYLVPERGEISISQRVPLLFNQLLDLATQEEIYSRRIIDYSVSLLMMELSQEFIEQKYKVRKNISPNLERTMEWIKANYNKELTIKEIADEMGYNANYLSTIFKKSTGMTIVQYINITRINVAKSMIINYGSSVKEVAYACGFVDDKYFMKVFKKLEGMTPSQYKKAFSKKKLNNGLTKVSL
ncbi:MAG: AraC family transcriptional regulator [bacterium]|nr:AraC family transcriptional regulator [bacterium]